MPAIRKNNRMFTSGYFNPLFNEEEATSIEKEADKTQIPYKKDLKEKEEIRESIIKAEEYKNFQREYEVIKNRTKKLKKAFRVIFKEYPELVYVCFTKSKEAAQWSACKYFKNSLHPAFPKTLKLSDYPSRCLRIHAFDKYYLVEKVPIPDLMKELDLTFHCSICGQGNFTYESYKSERCFIVEGEGDLNPFTKGYVLCYQCYQKYLNNVKE